MQNVSPFREPSLQEVDDFPGKVATAIHPGTPRQRAQAARELISELMPSANRAERRRALQAFQRKQKRGAK